MIDFLTKKCLRINIKLIFMKGIKCNKPALVAGEQIHAFATISSTGELNIQQDTNMIITSRPLNFTIKGALNVFWEIEDIEYKLDDCDEYRDDQYDIDENNNNKSNNDDDGPHISLPVLLYKNEKDKWQEEVVDVDIGLIINGEKISLGKASFTVSKDYIGHRKLCLPVRKNKASKKSMSSIKKRIPFLFKKNSDHITSSDSLRQSTSSVNNTKLFRLSKSANLDLEIDILDTLPHLYHEDRAINELDIQETITETEEQILTSQQPDDREIFLSRSNDDDRNGEIPNKILINNTASTQSTEITWEKKDMEGITQKNMLEKIRDSLSYGTSSASSENYDGSCRFINVCGQGCGSSVL